MFSEATGKAEEAGFSDEVGYRCVCCLLPLPSPALTFLSHPLGLRRLCLRQRGSPAEADEAGVQHLTGSKSLFIQPRTRRDSNYRSPLGPQHLRGLCLGAPAAVKFLDASRPRFLHYHTVPQCWSWESGAGGARGRCSHNYPLIEVSGRKCNLRGRQRRLCPRISRDETVPFLPDPVHGPSGSITQPRVFECVQRLPSWHRTPRGWARGGSRGGMSLSRPKAACFPRPDTTTGFTTQQTLTPLITQG